jgi:hypothetical protein
MIWSHFRSRCRTLQWRAVVKMLLSMTVSSGFTAQSENYQQHSRVAELPTHPQADNGFKANKYTTKNAKHGRALPPQRTVVVGCHFPAGEIRYRDHDARAVQITSWVASPRRAPKTGDQRHIQERADYDGLN